MVDDQGKKDYSLQTIAAALTREGKLDLALQIANSIPGKYNSVHCTIIAELEKAGEFDKALNVINSIDDSLSRDFEYEDLALALKDAGDLKKALEITNLIQDEDSADFKYSALKFITAEMIKKGEYENAEKIANDMGDWKSRAEILSDIAKMQYKEGKKDLALEKFQSALDIVDSLKNVDADIVTIFHRIMVLDGIAENLFEVGQDE